MPLKLTIDGKRVVISQREKEDVNKILICFINNLNNNVDKKEWTNYIIEGRKK